MTRTRLRRALSTVFPGHGLALLAALSALCLIPASATAADVPVWQVSSESFPSSLPPGGTGEYILHVRNFGAVASDGSRIRVVDQLPPGVEATSASGEIFGEPTGAEYWECTGTTVVTCLNNPTTIPAILPEGEPPTETRAGNPFIVISVKVAPGSSGSVQNAVSVSGGGGPEARGTEPSPLTSAPARFGMENFEQLVLNRDGTPADQAGGHPYELITSFTLNNNAEEEGLFQAAQEPKDLEVGLPPGFLGNANATPRCSRAAFDEGRAKASGGPLCPPDTRVGTESLIFGNLPFLLVTFPVFNLEPPAGVPSQFGFAFQTKLGFIDGGVRTGEGYALKVRLGNILQERILRSTLTLWGDPAEHGTGASGPPLLTNPTACGTPMTDLVSMDSWEQPAAVGASPFSYPFTASYPVTDARGDQLAMQGCQKLNFTPALVVRPETSATDSPTGLEVKLTVPQNEEDEGLATANLRDATVTLPAGLTVSPSVANGLQACAPEQIGLSNGAAPACPDPSKIGTVTVHSPLLQTPLTGSVYVAQQNDNPFGSLLAIYLTAEAEGAVIKLAGHVQANPANGQLTVSFDENPQLPFSDLTVNLFGGPRAAVMTPSACGAYTTTARLTAWNGAEVIPAIAPFDTSAGCTQGFAPSFTAGASGNAAGAFGTFSTTISRADSDQPLGAISVTTPPGLLGMLAKVPLCADAQAATGTCPAASLIGHTTESAGPGPDPVTVQGGQVFLTGPYKGAPFGLSILVPAVAGPFNLGTVNVRATIHVDPTTGQITIVSDPLPTILQGIPLDVRAINVSVDRPGFMFNPTSCEPLVTAATIASSQGASASPSSRFQAADCASMTFKPSFTASTHGNGTKHNGASLTVRIATHQGPPANPSVVGEANIHKVDVQLPLALPSRLTTLQKACTDLQFDANPAGCPLESLVGSAVARTPVLPVPLEGPAYLVSHGGAALPDLVIVLQGDGVRIDLTGETKITKGITYSKFETAPDAPIESFELRLPEGPYSVLAANGNLCGRTTTRTATKHITRRVHGHIIHTVRKVKKTTPAPLQMPTTITAQNGAVLQQNTNITTSGCPTATATKAKKATFRPKPPPRR
jgi:hypothetical protein